MTYDGTLHELLEKDSHCKALFEGFTPEMQVALQEQRQNIRTRQDLEHFAQGFQKQREDW